MKSNWRKKEKPPLLEARFEFTEFRVLMSFLDSLAEVAEEMDHHPNISFSRQHVSVVIYSKTETLNDTDFKLAEEIDVRHKQSIDFSKGVLE
ncbi:MAG: 4a-hydroxytetrahydrobiopterin dehydratase [Gammaproteobacteria bacterium]|nr:4a-hydroxytetrahydrobiopterin dehydratase [Gammaproteobacteria bacterium]